MPEQSDSQRMDQTPILETVKLCKYFKVRSNGEKATLKAVEDLSLIHI